MADIQAPTANAERNESLAMLAFVNTKPTPRNPQTPVPPNQMSRQTNFTQSYRNPMLTLLTQQKASQILSEA